jgi:flagellar motor switch protein FliM
MADDEILSQEEKDALLHGVESGDIDTQDSHGDTGDVRAFNFAAKESRRLSELPRLDTIQELFAEGVTDSLQRFYRSEPSIELKEKVSRSMTDFVQSLPSLTSISVCTAKPLEGQWLLVLDAKLLYIMVDRYFGGKGHSPKIAGAKQFTSIEQRLARQTIDLLLTEFKTAFEDVLDLNPEVELMEHNPDYLSMPVTDETVFQLTLEIGFTEQDKGQCHLILPYLLLEPIKERLGQAGTVASVRASSGWEQKIIAGLKTAAVDLSVTLGELDLTLREVLELSPGDVLPIKSPDDVTVKVDQITVFKGKFGVANGNNAVKITASELD